MAERLARLFGTEEDKVNCSFFFKIGACRHGEKCTRLHYKPPISQTLLIPHMYENPPIALAMAEGRNIPQEQAIEAIKHFEDFYEEVFIEISNYGEIEEVIVCDNIGDHLVGNLYVKFSHEDEAEKCMKGLSGRYYSGKLLKPEYSPVTDFRDTRCRQYDEGNCSRGGYCNFMHLKHISRQFKQQLFRQMYEDHPEYKNKRRFERRDNRENKYKEKNHRHKKKSDKSRERSRDRSHKNKVERSLKDKKSSKKNKYSRKHSRSRSQSESKNRSNQSQNSEERRRMIEEWNKEDGDN